MFIVFFYIVVIAICCDLFAVPFSIITNLRSCVCVYMCLCMFENSVS